MFRLTKEQQIEAIGYAREGITDQNIAFMVGLQGKHQLLEFIRVSDKFARRYRRARAEYRLELQRVRLDMIRANGKIASAQLMVEIKRAEDLLNSEGAAIDTTADEELFEVVINASSI